MNKFEFAIITPSYTPDFERCRLLCQSVEKFIAPKVNHYVIVERRDLKLFSQLETTNTKIIEVQSVIPWWIARVPFFHKSWLSLKTIPVRNWLMQQIVKISMAQHISETVLIFVDSDVSFVRPFNVHNLIHDDKVRLYRDPQGNEVQKQWHLKWHQSASSLLGLPDVDMMIPDYIGHIMSWKRTHVLEMYQHLENISHKSWTETLCNSWHLSEYVLYGIFIDRILKDKSDHYYDPKTLCLDYWLTESMNEEQVEKFLDKILPEHVAVMISSKAHMSVKQYEHLLRQVR